jgi:hypothetical protein
MSIQVVKAHKPKLKDTHTKRQCRKKGRDGGERTASTDGLRSKNRKMDNGLISQEDAPSAKTQYSALRSYIIGLKNTEEYEFLPDVASVIDDLIANIEIIDALPPDLNQVEFNYTEYAREIKKLYRRRYRQYQYRRPIGNPSNFIDDIPF